MCFIGFSLKGYRRLTRKGIAIIGCFYIGIESFVPALRVYTRIFIGNDDMPIVTHCDLVRPYGPPLLTWFNFNPSMDK